VDETHPSFYDHPLDHLPGPLLAEAMRQGALVTAARAVPTCDRFAMVRAYAEFVDFAEPQGPCEVSAVVATVHAGGERWT
jgi:hypothetical protein